MAVRTIEEILASIGERIGEDTSDEAINILDDVRDTFDSLTDSSNENWKQRYEENDANWRKRYKERFFNNVSDEDDIEDDVEDNPHEQKVMKFEDLFK